MKARTCHHQDCTGEVRGRGMCAKHYTAWCRANPDIRVHLLTAKAVKEVMPATQAEIIEKTGYQSETVKRMLKKLRAAGEVFIADHQPPSTLGTKFMPVFDLREHGEEDAKVTQRMRDEQRRKTWRDGFWRRKAIAATKSNGWAASLMAGM